MESRTSARDAGAQAGGHLAAIDLVSRIERVAPGLSPAGQRVAGAVRADLERATRITIADLAAIAGVSQPTVTRFCRSLGCRSFAEFKIHLAATLAVAAVYLRPQAGQGGDVAGLARTVMLRAAQAVRECLDQIDAVSLGTAIERLAASARIEIYGQGSGSAALAEDARLRLFRLGLPVAAYADGQQQRMSAATLQAGDGVLAISNSGRSRPVVEAVAMARSLGAATVAVTRPGTPLAEAAETVIGVTIAEGPNVLMPSPSRYAHLAVIDTLAAGIADRRGARAREALRRVRYTLASLGVAIAAPETDPEPVMKDFAPRD